MDSLQWPVEYQIDASDTICHVNDAWNRFAQAGEAPELLDSKPVGECLWRYIADAETRHIYEQMLLKVRRRQVLVSVPFRCDSAAERRFLWLSMSPLEDGGVGFACEVDRVEARESVPLLDPSQERSGEALLICGWCKRVRVSADAWEEIEQAVAMLHLFDGIPLPPISHGICPACLKEAYRAMTA